MDPRSLPPLPILNPNDVPKLRLAPTPTASPQAPSSAPPPRRGEAEKYGGLYYLGIGGLVALALLIGWFAYGIWSLSDVWSDVYLLNNDQQPEAERIAAAQRLSEHPNVTQRQCWDLAMNRALPTQARWLLAERLNAEAVAPDPSGYAKAIAYSEGWPNWYRALLARPLTIAADQGIRLSAEPLETLVRHEDPFVQALALRTLAVLANNPEPNRNQAFEQLTQLATANESVQPFAKLLLDSATKPELRPDRSRNPHNETLLMRKTHPDAAVIWK